MSSPHARSMSSSLHDAEIVTARRFQITQGKWTSGSRICFVFFACNALFFSFSSPPPPKLSLPKGLMLQNGPQIGTNRLVLLYHRESTASKVLKTF